MLSAKTSGLTEDLLQRVGSFISLQGLCERGQAVLVACSGGPDSTALLDLLRQLAPDLGISLGIIHVDHGQYPGSDRVLAQVRTRCRRWGLDFFGRRIGGKDLPPGSSEAALRGARLQTLREVAEANGYSRLATGHTETDQVETVLMRILRGTTTAGLTGIPASREDFFIRPLLCCTSGELRDYLKSRRLSFHEDPTNLSRDYLRNRIRLDVLPLLRQAVNPAVDQALLRLCNSATRDNHLLNQMARGVQPDRTDDDCVELPLALLENLHDAVLSRLLILMMLTICEPGANLEQQHVDRLLLAIQQGADFILDLPDGLQAYLQGGKFGLRSRSHPTSRGFHLTVEGPGEITIPDAGSRMRFSLQKTFDPRKASNRHVFFDANKIAFPLVVRSVAPGDRLSPWGIKGSRKVARLLLDAKIPRHTRRLVPLLVGKSKVLWVAGLRRSNLAPVSPGADRVLSVELLPAADTS